MDKDKQPYLYHFMPIHKFIDFMLNKALILTSLSYMEDPFDGISLIDTNYLHSLNLQQNIFDQDEFFRRITFKSPDVRKVLNNANLFRNRSLCCCFYYPKKSEESIAMWKLYSRKDSVALKIPKQELEKFINKNEFTHYSVFENGDNGLAQDNPIFLKRQIEYIDFFRKKVDNIPQGFLKHIDYSYENEYRLLMINDEKEIKKQEKKTEEDLQKFQNGFNEKSDSLDNFQRGKLSFQNRYKYIAYMLNPKIYKVVLSSDILSKSSIVASPFIEKWKLQNLKQLIKLLKFDIEFQFPLSLPKVIISSLSKNLY